MRNTRFAKAIAMLLCFVMVVSALPITALAAGETEAPKGMTVVKDTESTLAPGVTQNEIVLLNENGERIEVYVATADLNVETISVHANYKNNQNQVLGMSRLSEQVAAAEANHEEPYTVIAAVNGSFYNTSTGAPRGANVMEGVLGPSDPDGPANSRPFLAVVENTDGSTSVVIGNSGEWNEFYTKNKVLEAIGGERHLIDNGEIYQGVGKDAAARSAIGLTADGKLIILTADGSRAPYSVGMGLEELAETMLSLGCVEALLLDGGGSSTFGSRAEGTDSFEIINTPCDGGERTIANSFMIVSTAAPDGVFERAALSVDKEYVTPESTVNVTAVGADAAGGSAEIPADAVWCLKDNSFGTIENGVFTSNGKVGDAVVQLKVGDKVVGETTIHVVIPEIAFNQSNLVVPYGKQVVLGVVATTNGGINNVHLKAGDVTFALSNPDMGTLDGDKFTACAESSAINEGLITATLAYGTEVTASAKVIFGRESEVLYDFEDGKMPEGFETKSGYYYEGTYGRFENGFSEIVTSENGQVRHGEYALAVTANYSDNTSAGSYAVALEFPDIDLTGATAIGMWMYFSVDDMDPFFFGWCRTDQGKSADRILDLEYTVGKDGSGMEEDGWYYIKLDLSNTNWTKLTSIRFYARDNTEKIWNPYNEVTVFIDDITVDYSAAVEDREAPVFTDVFFGDSKLEDCQIITANTVKISANAVENTEKINYTGINNNSAIVYVDGVALENGVSSNAGTIVADNLYLPDGYHTIRFEIADNAGNYGAIERSVIINTKQGDVYFAPADPEAVLVPIGSVQWFNLVAKNVETVDAVTAVVDLDSLSQWELEGMQVLYGFEAEYEVNKFTNTATITVIRTGEVEAEGEAVLISLPVRTREWTAYLDEKYLTDADGDSEYGVSNDPDDRDWVYVLTPYAMWQTECNVLTRMEVELVSAAVKYVDDSFATYASERILVMTECNRYRNVGMYLADGTYVETDAVTGKQGKESWHIHTPGTASNKEATCTEVGYTNRIFCVGCSCDTMSVAGTECDTHDGCGSVVEWGTTVPAKGHAYKATDGVLKCACGHTYSGNGLVAIDENSYYLIANKLQSGWVLVENEWYYFDTTTYAAVESYNNGNVTFTFEADGKLVSGQWHNTSKGSRYYYGPDYYKGTNYGHKRVTIGGKDYVFDVNGYCLKGIAFEAVPYSTVYQWYDFGEDGAIKGAYKYTGLIEYNGHTYSVKDGVTIYGMSLVDGAYYYAGSANNQAVVKNTERVCPITNDLLPVGTYKFGADGKMLNPPVQPEDPKPEDPKPTGKLVKDDDGEIRYYVDGVATYAGLVQDEDGNYYYINSALKAVKNREYTIGEAKANGLLSAGTYTFGADGKMVTSGGGPGEPEPEDPKPVGKLVKDSDGEIRYYVDGVATYAGLVKDADGNYYYINSALKAVRNRKYEIGAAKANGLLPAGTYEFGADGKMKNPSAAPAVKNGLVKDDDGEIRYYVNDVATYAGLVKDSSGNYYYINSTLKAVKNCQYGIGAAKTNGLLSAGTYTFGADGKMVP